MQGETDIEQLAMVISSLGTPTEDSWPGLTTLPDYNKITFPESRRVPWETLIPECPQDALSLIQCFLVYDSNKRISAQEVSGFFMILLIKMRILSNQIMNNA